MAAQDDIDGSPPARRRHLADIGADALTNVVSDNTREDFFSGPRLASCDAGVMRIVLDRSEAMKAVLGRPCVMEKLHELWSSDDQPLSEECTITPLDATPLPTRIFSRPQDWVGVNGDWLAFLLRNGGIQLHHVYTGMTVDVPPFTFIGFRHAGKWEYRVRAFDYDLIRPELKKIAIAGPPDLRYSGTEHYDLIAVFDKKIAITGRSGVTNFLTWYMLATPHLTPWRYEDAVYSGGRYYAVTDNGTCYMWDPESGGSMQPPLLIRAPQVVEDRVPQNGWHNWTHEWYLLPDCHGYFSQGTLLLGRVAIEVTGNEPIIPYLNRTILCYKNASCDVFRINASQRDLRGAEWEAIIDLGQYSIFLGTSYPRMMEVSPMRIGDDGLPFIKLGCVFIARCRISNWGAPTPDLCHFPLDGSAMLDCNLPSCSTTQQSAPVWIVSSLQNFNEWNDLDEENDVDEDNA